jgi:hypothetical protein
MNNHPFNNLMKKSKQDRYNELSYLIKTQERKVKDETEKLKEMKSEAKLLNFELNIKL